MWRFGVTQDPQTNLYARVHAANVNLSLAHLYALNMFALAKISNSSWWVNYLKQNNVYELKWSYLTSFQWYRNKLTYTISKD